MDLTTLATTIFNFVKPVILTQITNDFKEATKNTMLHLWNKIKPIFIIEDKDVEELKDIKSAPDDIDFENAFISKLKITIKKDNEFRTELESILLDIENSDNEQAKIIIQNSKNVNTGNISNVVGDIIFGDNTKKQ